jgi:hypothetical protein
MENDMKHRISTVSGAALLALGAAAAIQTPAFAAQSRLSQIIFGKAYNDGVTAVQITSQARHDGELPISVIYATANTMRSAQATVGADAHLRQAIADRGIALHNVVKVETALNGGHVLYYR